MANLFDPYTTNLKEAEATRQGLLKQWGLEGNIPFDTSSTLPSHGVRQGSVRVAFRRGRTKQDVPNVGLVSRTRAVGLWYELNTGKWWVQDNLAVIEGAPKHEQFYSPFAAIAHWELTSGEIQL